MSRRQRSSNRSGKQLRGSADVDDEDFSGVGVCAGGVETYFPGYEGCGGLGPDGGAEGIASDDWARLPASQRQKLREIQKKNLSERYRRIISEYHSRLARHRPK